jgi:alpha-N-arabinofuranosidase
MANIAQTINVLQSVILTEGAKMILTPTYHVFDMYKVHQDAVKIPVYVESENCSAGFVSIPAVSASASVDDEGRFHVSLTNADPRSEREIKIELTGFEPQSVSGQIISSADMRDHNTFENPDAVTIKPFTGAALAGSGRRSVVTAKLPAKSVVTLEIL